VVLNGYYFLESYGSIEDGQSKVASFTIDDDEGFWERE